MKSALVLLACLASLSGTSTQTVSPPDNKGREFIVMFMENLKLGTQTFQLELYLATQEKHDVTVHITSPKWNNPKIDLTVKVRDGVVEKVQLDPAFKMSGSNVSSKGLLITADGDIACYGANKETLSNDVYLCLPIDAVGTDYYAMSYSPASIKSEIGIAGTKDGTSVSVTLPQNNGPVDVNFNGKTYHAGDTINVNLDKYDTLQLQSTGDLTGAHIQSSQSVSVFSGNIKTTVTTGNFSDHLVEQMVPTDRWGKRFVTAPIPGRTVGDVFRIVAKSDNTVVTIPGKGQITLSKGEVYTFDLPSDSYNSITSSEPIMLAQFVKTQRSGSEPADPSMMIIPPYEQFGSDYTFATPEYSHPEYGPTFRYQNEFMIVAKKSETAGLLLDGKPFPTTTWHDIPGTDLVGSYVTLPHGVHTVRHLNPLSTFGGYLYGHAYHESYGFPTGMRTGIIYDPNCKPTPPVVGDGIDNDCDNKIDEELCDGTNTDDDGDNKIDEDCVRTFPVDGQWGPWGQWSNKCSVTCGDGVLTRQRVCDSPAPKFGGKTCKGNDTETKHCYGGSPCSVDIGKICAANQSAIIPNPQNCAQYYDCTRTSNLGQPHLFECPYPQLFSNISMKCEDFEKVDCYRRMEPMAPCDYEQNKCNGSDPNCKPCPQRLASCVGENDGRLPLVVFSSEYKDCKKNRTMNQGECDFGYYNPGPKRCLPHNTGTLAINCKRHPTALFAVPGKCAKFYNCSKTGNTLPDKTDECQYPHLFSLTTKHCENFTTVNCSSRQEPKAPCEYDQFKCSPTNTTCNCSHEHANCVGQADGMEPFPTRLWSPDYATCFKDRTLKQPHCSHGYFHPITKKCTDTVKPNEVKDVCKANPTMVFEDSTDCAKFYNCSQMNTLLGNYKVECTYPDLFSVNSGRCEPFDQVNCGQKQEPMAPCQYDQNIIKLCPSTNQSCPQCTNKLPSCVGLQDGSQPIQNKMWSSTYVTCTKNRTVLPIKSCSKGYFHPVLMKCTEDVNKTDARPYCQANPGSVVQVSDNCAQYINCTAVLAMAPTSDPVQECKYPDLFSTQTMSCQDFTTVHCDKRKEPKAPCEYKQNLCQLNNKTCTPCQDRLPSCVGEKDGNQAFKTREWKPDYVSCTKDRTVIPTKTCVKGYFHPVLGVCTEDINKTDAVPYCKANPTAVIPDKNNCAKYIDCSVVNTMAPTSDPIQECQYPDLFSTQTMTCQDFTTVQCGKRREPKAPCEYDKNKCDPADKTCIQCQDRLPSCVGQSDGNHAFPARLWKQDYISCTKDRTVLPAKTCPKGYFHPTLEICREDVTKPDAKPYCQANPMEILPMSDNCAHYINCTVYLGGSSMADPVQECQYPDLFSTISMTCQDFTTVVCNTRPEPQAPCQYDQNICPKSNTSCPACPDTLPSCIGLADGNQPFPSRMWKPDYVQCYKNRTVIPTKACVKGFFHPTQKRCLEDIPKSDIKPYCQANPTAVVPMSDNCAQYINCTAVLAMASRADPIQECKYPDLFSTQTMSCHDFRTVQCDRRREPMAPCDYKQNLCSTLNTPGCEPCQSRLPSCVSIQDGDQPFPTKLWTENYVHCLKNRTIGVDKCPSGAVFDPDAHTCTTKIKSGSMDAFCKVNPTVIKVNPDNCAQYYNCSDPNTKLGHHLTECYYPDLFSMVTLRCERFDTVQCSNRSEPQAPCEYMQNLCDKSNTTCERCPSRLPTCVGQPDGDHTFPTRMWKPDYITCNKNRTILPTKTCPTGYFHPIKEMCIDDVTKPDAMEYCKANPKDLLPVSGNCAQYIDCDLYLTGQVSDPVQECHYPDLWSLTLKSCQNFTSVSCGSRMEPRAPCQYEQNLCPANSINCKKCPDRLPSCVGMPDGPQSYPGELWKQDYVTCYKNRTVLPVKHCKLGYFHPTLKQCTEIVTKVDATPYCQSNPFAIIPMSDNCAHFINCSALNSGGSNMQPVQECTYPDLFSRQSLSCQRFTTVDCDTRMEPQAPCEYDQNFCSPTNFTCEVCINRLPSCIGLPDGAQPFPTRFWLRDYIQCYRNRTMTLRKCNQGDVFDPVSLGCVSDVPASKMDSYCKANPGVIKVNPDNCAQYFNCSDPSSPYGQHLEECKYPSLFSDVTLRCEQFDTVTCDKRKEPQAPCDYKQNQCTANATACTPCPDRIPSCVGQNDGNHAFLARLWSPDFETCYKNRTTAIQRCPNGYFHPVQESCETKIDKVDAPKYCAGNPTSIIEVQDNCAQYIDCDSYTKGKISDPVQECHYPDLFSTVNMRCQDFSTVSCDQRLEPKAPCEYSQNICPKSDPACEPCQDKFPSCIGLQDGDHAFPTHLWGSDYVTCDRNRTVIPAKKCPGGGYFHPIQGLCTKTVDPTDANNYCGANPKDVFPMVTDCAKFYNCTRVLEGYTDVIQECVYPDLFSTLSLTCQDFTTVQCDKRPEPQAPCEYTQNRCDPNDLGCKPCPERLPSCVGFGDGDQEAVGYTWTDMYVRCYRNRTLTVEHCPSGAVFDPKNRACVSKINPGDIDSFCRANPGAVKPVDTNCAQYYKCSNTVTGTVKYVQECNYPDLFSMVSLQCEQFETVPCGTRPEPQAPCDYLKNVCNGTDPSCTPCPERLPSCVGLPDGYNPYPNREWKSDYLECNRNRTVSVKQCKLGYFHPVVEICTDTLQRGDVKDFCMNNPTVVMAMEDNCAQYINCSQPGSTSPLEEFIGECKYPQLFSSLTNSCGTFTRILCDTRPEPQAPCEYEKNLCLKTDPGCEPCPERLPSCVGLHDGAHPHPNRLWTATYIECFYNRTMAVKNCSVGYFHPADRRCQTSVDPVDVPNYCAEHRNSIITAPDNCAIYYNCSSPGTGYRTECNYPDLYDITTKMCRDFTTVTCQSRPEPVAPCQYRENLCQPGDSTCAPCQERLPSCMGLSDGNQYFEGKEWSSFYITCKQNRTITISQCKTGYFNPRLRVCTDSIDTPDVPRYCTAHPNSIIPSPSNCAQYINCTSPSAQTLVIKECDYPDLFSRDTVACARFTRVNCDTRTEPQAPCEYNQNLCSRGDLTCSPCPERLPSCIGKQDGAQPFPGHEWTGTYVECFRNRTMAIRNCPTGAVFDAYQHSCVSRIDKNYIQSFCQFNHQAVKEHPDNCAQYFDCSQPASQLGPYLMECDYPKLFSSQSLTCVDFELAQCDQKKEPQTPCEYLRNLCGAQNIQCTPCLSRLPSCLGLVDGKQPIQGKLWLADYVNCRKNRTISIERCQPGYFHPQQKQCVQDINAVNIQSYCHVHQTDVLVDPRSCARYFNCTYISSPLGSYQQECVYPDLFDATLRMCRPFHSVTCQQRPEPVNACDYVRNLCDPADSYCKACTERYPSCHGKPDGNNPYPGLLWKQDYIVCDKNRTVSVERCPTGYFSERTRACESSVLPVDITAYCRANPTVILANPNSCSQYFECPKILSASGRISECKYPDLFSVQTTSCEPFETVQCLDRPEPQEPCSYNQNLCPISDPSCKPCLSRLPSCVGQSDGQHTFAGQQWTTRYVECYKNRTLKVAECPRGSYFSPRIEKCIQNINIVDIVSFCQANPTVIRAHPSNCAQYYDCSALNFGGDYLKECPYPDLFDVGTLACRKVTEVKCGARHEPKSPCEYVKNLCPSSQPSCVPCPQRLPSCTGKSDGNHAFPGKLWQQPYIVCDQERTISTPSCSSAMVFDPNSNRCVDDKNIGKYDIPDYCKTHPAAVLPDPEDCSRYYDCKSMLQGGISHFQCHYPDLFSALESKCVEYSRVDCEHRREPFSPCQYDHNLCSASDSSCVACQVRLPDCTGLPDGENAVTGMLWSVNYIVCQSNRTTDVKQCRRGVFDPNVRKCSETVGPQHIRDLCRSNPYAIVPHPTNCAQYFNCTKERTDFGHYLMECKYPMLFDSNALQCQMYQTVQCGNRMEPQAPCDYFQNLCATGNLTCIPCPQRLPSCVRQPDGNFAYPGRAWTKEYVHCDRNRTIAVYNCRMGYFDPRTRSCVDQVPPVSIPEFCEANPHAVVPDTNNCGRYYDCSQSASNHHQECKYPQLFSTQMMTCEDFRSVTCDQRPEPQTSCEYSQNLCLVGDLSCIPCNQRNPSCKGLPDGINAAPNALWSKTYIQCLKNRTLVVDKCKQGLFDPSHKSCVKYIDPNKINEICRNNPVAVFPDPSNCAKYYDCKASQSFAVQYHKECSYPDLFSMITNRCESYDQVNCDTRMEPQAPCEYSGNLCASNIGCKPCPERLPSCRGLRDGTNSFPGRPWGSNYIECTNNRTDAVKNCPTGAVFNPTLKACVSDVDPAHAKEFCDWNPQAVVPNMYNAAQYIDCTRPGSIQGIPHLQECPYPDLFDSAIQCCRNFTEVPSDQRPQPQAPCEYQQNLCNPNTPGCIPCPQRLFSCVGSPNGANGIEGNSWVPDYIECYKNRTMGTKKCGGQKVFDPLKRECAEQSPLSIQDQCRLFPNKIITHQGSCSLYYNCSKTEATFHFGPVLPVQLEECPYPDLFSTVYQQCLDFQSVDCEDRHEVQAPCQYLQNQCNPADSSCVRCPERLPNCEGLPDGENPVPGHHWSHDYVRCYKNRTLSVESCRNGYFNPWSRKCVNSIKKDDVDDFCKANPKAVIADLDNCAHSFNCDKQKRQSSSTAEECKYPDLFSTITSRCESFIKVNCETRPEPQAPCEYQQNLCPAGDMTCEPCVIRLPSCIGLPDGNDAVPGREYTDTYLQCQLNRTMSVKKCDVGFFDASLHICVTAINSGNIGPYCNQNQYAVLPHPTNCAWYYNCSVTGRTLQSVYPYDIEYVQECPYPLLFSSATLRCENFQGVTCNSHFEPQAPCEYYKNRCDPTKPGCIPCPNRIPSCKNLPDGQQKIANFYDGNNYLVQCLTNRTMSYDVCKTGMIGCYDQVTVLTTPTIPATTVVSHGVCDQHRGQLVPNPTHCGQYYDCTRSAPPYIQECTYPQMFSEFTLRCQDFRAVSCHARPEYKQPCDYQQNLCLISDPTCTPCSQRLPSCLNLPDGDHPFPGRKWTTAYITCLRGRTMFVGDCLTGTFEPNVRRCVFPTTMKPTIPLITNRPAVRTTTRRTTIRWFTPAPTTVNPNTPENYCKYHPYEKLQSPSNCAQYYDCRDIFTSNVIALRECPYPQLYQRSLQICMDFNMVSCESKYEPQAPCEYDQNQCHTTNCLPCTQRFVSCKGLTDGNHAHPTRDSTWYIRCQGNRTMGVEHCTSGVFDSITKQCRTVNPTSGDPLTDFCKKNPYGYMANPQNCAQYYTCQNVITQLGNHLMECPYPQLFDAVSQRCQGRDFVQCGQRKEPASACDYKLYQCVGIGCILCPGQVQVTTRAPVVITQVPVGPTCTGKPNGLNPYPGRELTGHYILCDNGVVIETGICILNKILDPASHTCIDPANPAIIDAYCRKNPGTSIPSVTNCAQFYVCGSQFGRVTHELRQCAFSQLFSTVYNTCQPYTQVQCGQRNQVQG